jgi:hypothetical protein
MPAFRGPDGKIVYVSDDEAQRYDAAGYERVGEAAAGAAQTRIEPTDNGALGTLGAAASGALSGATLGASDWLLKGALTQGEFEQLAEDRRANPTTAGLAQFAGAFIPAIATGGAATPTGALSRLAAGTIEGAEAAGGAAGAARALAAAGTEGAIQNAGIYLSDVALGDRDLTAEGMTGALGTGFVFGAGGLVAAHGVQAGTMAARRMFARYAEGGEEAASAAQSAWRDQGTASLESFEQAAELARARLSEARLAREQADVARRQAAAAQAEAKVAPLPPEAPPVYVGRPDHVPTAPAGTESAAAAPRPGEPGFRRVYSSGTAEPTVAPAPEPAPAPEVAVTPEPVQTPELAQAPVAPSSPGFATMIRDLEAIPGVQRIPVTEEEYALSRALDEYDSAKAAFHDIHATVDPDLDALMRGLEAPGVSSRQLNVPVGEFGAPGQRGIKSPAEIERAAAESGLPEAQFAGGTPRGLGEVAAEQSPVTRVGKRKTGEVAEPAPAPRSRPGLPDRARVAGRYNVAEGTPAPPTATAEPTGPEPIVPGRKITELARPGEAPEDFVLRRMREQGERAFDRPDAQEVWLGSLGIDWTVPENRAIALKMLREDKAILSRADLQDMFDSRMLEASHVGDDFGDFHFIHDTGPRRAQAAAPAPVPAQEAETELEALLRGTKARLDQGEELVAMGEPARSEYRAAKAERSAQAAEHFRAKAIEAHEVPSYDAVKAHEARADAALDQTIPARKIATRGYFEPPVRGGGTLEEADPVRMAKARAAIAEGQREAIDLSVTKSGKITVEGGRHRLAAAIEADAPIKVRWSAGAEPSEDLVFRGAGGESRDVERFTVKHRFLGDTPMTMKIEHEETLAGRKLTKVEVTRIGQDGDPLVVGTAEFSHRSGGLYPEHVVIDQPFQRIGIGTRMYDAVEARTGQKILQSTDQTEQGAAFRAAREARRAKHDTELEAMLRGTKQRLDAGEAMRDIARGEHPLAVKRLEMAHDAAAERAATATEPEVKQAAEAEVKAIEAQLTRVGARPGAVEDVAAVAPVVARLEKAAADLTEALGDAAPAAAKEHAKAFRAAEDKATEKTVSRIAMAADDHAAMSDAERAEFFLGPGTRQRNVEAAKKSRMEAEAVYQRARATEAEAQLASRRADALSQRLIEERARRAGASAQGDAAKPAAHRGVGEKVIAGAHAVGYAAELGSDLGIPGIPRPHDIPIIGPLLSAYLKYRALRAAAGRFVGRVPATATTRAAELAARTRDGLARAVDRSLGLIERSKPAVRTGLSLAAVRAGDALSKRIVDDGMPDAPAGSNLQQQASVRMREVAAVVANPRLVLDKISVETRGITDPDLIRALTTHVLATFQHLNDTAPKGPPPNPYTKRQWVPSAADAMQWGQRVAVAQNPQVAFDLLEEGSLTPAPADTMRVVYAKLFAEAQKRFIARAMDLEHPVEYKRLLQQALLFDVPLHPSLDTENAAVIRTAFSASSRGIAPPQQPGAPPVPGVAAPTNINAIYQSGMDRSLGGR